MINQEAHRILINLSPDAHRNKSYVNNFCQKVNNVSYHLYGGPMRSILLLSFRLVPRCIDVAGGGHLSEHSQMGDNCLFELLCAGRKLRKNLQHCLRQLRL